MTRQSGGRRAPHFVGIEFASNWAIENFKDASRLVGSVSERMESPGKSKE
jgi:hypothetical protein